MHCRCWVFLFVFAALSLRPADAAPRPERPQPAGAAGGEAPKPPAPAEEKPPVVTHHQITVGGRVIAYTATAGYMPMRDEAGRLKANIFYVAYERDGQDRQTRPITFAFNGGPGAASVWLHMGAFGPWRVVMGPEGQAPPPPYRMEDNPDTLLDVTDLVFIDPVTTGYSRAAPGEDPRQFHGVEEDVQSVGDFIRLYTTRKKRWLSPKFLAGESYGTTRAAGLSGYLQQHDGLYLNGIILLSAVLNFETISFDRGNDLPYLLYLPTYTAAAWYHHRLPAELQADRQRALAEAETFALGDYAHALLEGDALPAAERGEIIRKLARYTGLSPEYIERTGLRIEASRFRKELLRDQRRTLGRYDSRFTGIDVDAAGETPDYDPSWSAVQGVFTAVINDYLRTELGFESDLPYETLTGRVHPWNFGSAQNRFLDVADTLRSAMTENPALQVYIACGYDDLATPFLATKYTVSHMDLDPSLRDHLRLGFFDAGHMMYIDRHAADRLKADVTAFIRRAAVTTPAAPVH